MTLKGRWGVVFCFQIQVIVPCISGAASAFDLLPFISDISGGSKGAPEGALGAPYGPKLS